MGILGFELKCFNSSEKLLTKFLFESSVEISFTLKKEEGFADLDAAGREEIEDEEAALPPPLTSLSDPLPR